LRKACSGRLPCGVYPKRLRNVLQLLLTDVVKENVDLAVNFAIDLFGNEDAARFRNTFQTGCNIDAFTEDVPAVLDDDISEIHSDAKL